MLYSIPEDNAALKLVQLLQQANKGLVKEAVREVLIEENLIPQISLKKEEETLDVLGVAEVAQCTPGTVRTWARKKKIPYARPGGKTLIFFRSDVIKFLKSHRQGSKDEIAAEAEAQFLLANGKK